MNAAKGIPADSPPAIFVTLLNFDASFNFDIPKSINFFLSFGNEIMRLQSQYTGLYLPDVNLNCFFGLKLIHFKSMRISAASSDIFLTITKGL